MRDGLMIGIQNMGYLGTLLYESRTNLVKFTSLSWPNFCGSMDDIRASPGSFGRISTHTPTIAFFNNTEHTTNRWPAGRVECGLLDRQYSRRSI